MIVLVSPHLDDAALSAGQLIVDWAQGGLVPVRVITVLAGIPAGELPVTDYDVRSGFVRADVAVDTRRQEDRRAMAVLGAIPVHLDFMDRQYAQPVDEQAVNDALFDQFALEEVHAAFIPLGLAHPDHELVARAARAAAAATRVMVYAWEDLPTRVVRPETVAPALEELEAEGWIASPRALTAGPVAIKEAALACYQSQRWALEPVRHACLVPERFWELTWQGG